MKKKTNPTPTGSPSNFTAEIISSKGASSKKTNGKHSDKNNGKIYFA